MKDLGKFQIAADRTLSYMDGQLKKKKEKKAIF